MKPHCKKRGCRSILFFGFEVVLCYSLFLFITSFNFNNKLNNIRHHFKATTKKGERIPNNAVTLMTELSENELPLCVGNLLDQQEYNYIEFARGSYDDSSRLISKRGSCKLLHYSAENAVACLGALKRGSTKNTLHFAFMGDSRIRQQFYNFVRLLPDYDKKSDPTPIPFNYHGDVEVTSNILELKVSFKWRPLINDNVTETIRQWTNNERPYLIFLSMALHHLAQSHSVDDLELYRKRLSELVPILGQLANYSQVIWLNQYPTVAFTVSEKVHYFNKAIRVLLQYQNYTSRPNIRVWDSSNAMAEEYVRGCAVFWRDQSLDSFLPIVEYANSFINCNDNVHTGNSALSQAMQLFYNDMCNAYHL